MSFTTDPQVIEILYTNQQGDLAKLSIRPSKISFGKIPFFEHEQWLLHALMSNSTRTDISSQRYPSLVAA